MSREPGAVHRELTAKRYVVWYRDVRYAATLPEAIYDDLYLARNRFLHGQPVRGNHLHHRHSGRFLTLIELAPVLYNAALLSFLKGNVEGGPDETATFVEYARRREGLRVVQDALITARYPLDEYGHSKKP